MKMPITSLTVFTPSGRNITIVPNPSTKTMMISGPVNGEILLTIEEAFAIKQILGIMIE